MLHAFPAILVLVKLILAASSAADGETMADKSKPNQISVRKTDDGWTAKRAGGERSSILGSGDPGGRRRAAKDLARRTGGVEVITTGRDGNIRSSDTIAKGDPNPPRDREH
jgi:hypothetical protein